MYLILSDRGDVSAQWAYLGLRRKGIEPLMFVTGDMLAAARRLDHRIGAGPPTFEITLPDGRTILSQDIRAGLNRLAAVPPQQAASSKPADFDYAAQELYALYLSIFTVIGARLANRPSPQGLAGPWLSRIEWLRLAHAAGLETQDFAESTSGASGPGDGDFTASETGHTRRVVVVGDEAFGDAPPATALGSVRLAGLAGCRILGLEFLVERQSWRFASATATPDLIAGGDGLLDRLVVVLTDLAGRPQ
jgi:hypothetical protein